VNLDTLWAQQDQANVGGLSKSQSILFLQEVAECALDREVAKNFDESSWEEQLNELAEEKNGFIPKQDMANFIKETFVNAIH